MKKKKISITENLTYSMLCGVVGYSFFIMGIHTIRDSSGRLFVDLIKVAITFAIALCVSALNVKIIIDLIRGIKQRNITG